MSLLMHFSQQLQMYHQFLPLMGRKSSVKDPLTAEMSFNEVKMMAEEVDGHFEVEYHSSKVSIIWDSRFILVPLI